MREHGTFPVTALILCALMLTLVLVLVTDGARFFLPKRTERMLAEVLLEELDGAAAAALHEESAFSVDGSPTCAAVQIGEAEASLRRAESRDGRILSLPSCRRFCVRLSLLMEGNRTEDGFLAFGSRRILPGAHVVLDGERVTAAGRILALKPAEAQNTEANANISPPIFGTLTKTEEKSLIY